MLVRIVLLALLHKYLILVEIQEMLLFVAIFLLIIILSYVAVFCSPTKENFSQNVPPTIEKRTAGVLLSLHDVATNPMANTNDINVSYKLWTSAMLKRGVPDSYVTPELFDVLRNATIQRQLTPTTVMKHIAPYYEQEERKNDNETPELRDIRVCSN